MGNLLLNVVEAGIGAALGGAGAWWIATRPWWWNPMSDWCVPASALRWGELTTTPPWLLATEFHTEVPAGDLPEITMWDVDSPLWRRRN